MIATFTNLLDCIWLQRFGLANEMIQVSAHNSLNDLLSVFQVWVFRMQNLLKDRV